jgi:hypothetical protein
MKKVSSLLSSCPYPFLLFIIRNSHDFTTKSCPPNLVSSEVLISEKIIRIFDDQLIDPILVGEGIEPIFGNPPKRVKILPQGHKRFDTATSVGFASALRDVLS